eukprot:Em0013g297a
MGGGRQGKRIPGHSGPSHFLDELSRLQHKSETAHHRNGLVLSDLECCPKLDVTIDGADEWDAKLNCIKGGGVNSSFALMAEAVRRRKRWWLHVQAKFVVIADHNKQSTYLGEKWTKGLPIEVLAFAYKPVKLQLEAIGGVAELRMAIKKAGPVVTDNGNLILDWKFPASPGQDWVAMATQLSLIPGIVETGLFVNLISRVYFGQPDGTVVVHDK